MSCSHTAEFDAPRWTEPTPDAQDACPDCAAKGMLFAGPELRNGPSGPVVDALAAKARS